MLRRCSRETEENSSFSVTSLVFFSYLRVTRHKTANALFLFATLNHEDILCFIIIFAPFVAVLRREKNRRRRQQTRSLDSVLFIVSFSFSSRVREEKKWLRRRVDEEKRRRRR